MTRIELGLLLITAVACGRMTAGAADKGSGLPGDPATTRPCFSGVYPHLAHFNTGNECGTGAVVPWAGRLWVITYSPHEPRGSDDKLYEIDGHLHRTTRPESVGGTPANRMIHDESQQLFIGPYVIDRDRNVRVIPPEKMPGRLTGTARHLDDPAGKVYFATMEEGFYEVDVRTLDVKELYPDGNRSSDIAGKLLPGYHGKGLYSGQGVLAYANNGEKSPKAMENPSIVSGCLAEWDGGNWQVVCRNQFTEVTGPGGIHGNEHPETEPIWSIGWDHRSLILMVRDSGAWRRFRLPKASHTYDGAHGWNTEWPRIRDIGEEDLLMTMHGMFWAFPRGFSSRDSSGIRPRSTYLKVIGDFCRWNEHIVLGCDDAAKSEFLNKRKAKGKVAPPGQSQSNLRFIQPGQLDGFGPAIGRGAVWMSDTVRADTPSDPFLFSGFQYRGVHLAHNNKHPVQFTFEVDADGTGNWTVLRTVTVPAAGYEWFGFAPTEQGAWLRIRANRDCQQATACFQYADADPRTRESQDIFDGLAGPEDRSATGGLVRACGGEGRPLQLALRRVQDGRLKELGYYEMDVDMKLRPVDNTAAYAWMEDKLAVPTGAITSDAASALYIDDAGRRYRLPKGDVSFDQPGLLGPERVDREVCTERDLFNFHGTFYELPAENAGGFAKIRPIATHNRHITDYCSWRGLLVMTGIADDAPQGNRHVIRSEDGQCAVWVGEVDDLWKLGKPAGQGGPWKNASVEAGKPSDPYLMTGYDGKHVELSHDASENVGFTLEVDAAGNGWLPYGTFNVAPGETMRHSLPEGFNAYWVRTSVDKNCVATAWFVYD